MTAPITYDFGAGRIDPVVLVQNLHALYRNESLMRKRMQGQLWQRIAEGKRRDG